jgi:hypothetical protein
MRAMILALSVREIIFADDAVIAKKQNGEYRPSTLHKWIFCFIPQVTYPDGSSQYK